MRVSPTFSVYFARHFIFWLCCIFFVLLGVVALFDFVELLRRASGKADTSLAIVFQMSAFKLPQLVQDMLPFSVLFGAMFSFWRLARSQELVVARAAGVSAWQFLTPALCISLLVGMLQIGLFNPVASIMLAQFERLENRHLKHTTSLLAVSKNGLWLRQADKGGQSAIYATRMSQSDMTLQQVIFFLFKGRDSFVGRIDAESAKLEDGYWDIRNAWISAPNKAARFTESYRHPTDLTLEKIQDSFASPETMSFWDLPAFIKTLETAGFSGHRHRLYWHSLLSIPILLCAVVLIAATFSIRISKNWNTGIMIVSGIGTGFVLYFLTDVVYALGLSANIPVFLAAWTPAGVSLALGIAGLLHLEDG
jgi:lipopolysaccharide export system permease protein